MLLRISLITWIGLFFMTGLAIASSEGSGGFSVEEKLIRQKVRTRAYPGGRDEEPLRVQAQLSTANRKVLPTVESTEGNDSGPSDSSDSND